MALGLTNVEVHVGDGTQGYPGAAPYDAIVVTAGAPETPETLKRQLRIGGRLVCPIGPRDNQQLVLIQRTGNGFAEQVGVGCVFVPLIGAEGWPG